MPFDLFSVMFGVVFVVVIGTFIVVGVKGITQWSKNNNSPKLSVSALIVSKASHRSHSGHTDANGHHHSSSHTTHTVTFEVESGDRMFFQMPSVDFNLLAEGDRGILHFQGTRFLGFDRYR